jgi:hypothetical protein
VVGAEIGYLFLKEDFETQKKKKKNKKKSGKSE